MKYESPLNNGLSNNPPPVHRLPSELLSRIFILGADTYRPSRQASLKDFRLQDVATQVCCYWREVGLRTPMLWTYIFVSGPSSHLRAQLYLTRAGPLCQLDIELDVPDTKPDEVSTQALPILRLIVSCGGDIARWRSLTVLTHEPLAALTVIGSISSSSMPALQFVSIEQRRSDALHDIEAMVVARMNLGHSHLLPLGHQAPQLRGVELTGLPSGLIFHRASPMISNLRYLKLGCGATPYPINGIGKLLSANPKLEYLYLDMGVVYNSDLESDITFPSKVFLPSLCSLSLLTHMATKWGISLLKMIDAPSVESFRLDCGHTFHLGEILQFISTGRLKGVLQSYSSSPEPQRGSIFPSLRSLKINDLSIETSFMETFLAAHPTLTEITTGVMTLRDIACLPALLPNLSCIRYSDLLIYPYVKFLQMTVEGRTQNRLPPVQVVALRRGRIQEDISAKYEELKILRRLVGQVEFYDDDDDYAADDNY